MNKHIKFIFYLILLSIISALFSTFVFAEDADKAQQTKETVLSAPDIISPKEIAEIGINSPVLIKWSKTDGASGYHMIVARDRRFKRIVLEDKSLTGDSYTLTDLNYGTYFLKIAPVSASGKEGAFSKIRTFIIVPMPTKTK